MRRSSLVRGVPIVATAAAALLPAAGVSDFTLHLLVLMAIFAIFAMSLDVLMGYGNLPSLGHSAFFGLAGYAVGIATVKFGQPWWVGVAIGLALCFAIGLLFGLVALRTHGLYFLLITLALGQLLWGAANRWGSFTGGFNGLPGIPRPAEWLVPTSNFYLLALALLVVAWLVMQRLVDSPFGLALKAVSESETRAAALGYDVWLTKYAAFVIAGVIAGVAGALNALYLQFISPRDLSIALSAEAILMVIVGGTRTLWGSIIGAVLIVGLRHYLSLFFDHWLIVLGAFFIVIVLFAPDGIAGLLRRGEGRREASDTEPLAVARVTPAPANDPVPLAAAAPTRLPLSADDIPALEVRALRKTFGGVVAVRDVSLTIGRGERVALLGPNGAGKTTLFHMVSGRLAPTSGEIRLFGEDITRFPPHRRARAGIGRTFQITNLFPRLSVIDHLRLCALSLAGRRFDMVHRADAIPAVESAAQAAVARLGLAAEASRLARTLSYGHQRQLEVAMAVAMQPKVLLLDEPAAGLSPAEIGPIVETIRNLDRSITLIIVEHDMDVALAVADRVIVFHHGEVIAEGTPDSIRGNAEVQRIYLGRRRA